MHCLSQQDVWSHREHLEFFDGSYHASNLQQLIDLGGTEQQLARTRLRYTSRAAHPTLLQKDYITKKINSVTRNTAI